MSDAITYSVESYNTATQSTNRMHDDTVAQTYGFRGGLVPGVDVWAYMTRPCVERWGVDFLTSGRMHARFRSPVYDGEVVTVSLDDDGALVAAGPEGDERATGSADLAVDRALRELPSAPLVESPPPVAAALLAPGTVLGTITFGYHAAEAHAYLVDVRDDSAVYADGAICHPGFLARQANYVLSRSVRLGPWIHVETTAWHRGLVHDGNQVEVRGIVRDEYERTGHRFVEIDVEITADGAPVWSAAHTAIWLPRTVVPAG